MAATGMAQASLSTGTRSHLLHACRVVNYKAAS
jgi:hypothetical protein